MPEPTPTVSTLQAILDVFIRRLLLDQAELNDHGVIPERCRACSRD